MLILFKFANSLLSCDWHTFLFDELPGTKLFCLLTRNLYHLLLKTQCFITYVRSPLFLINVIFSVKTYLATFITENTNVSSKT